MQRSEKRRREMTSRSRSDVQIKLTASQSGNSVTNAAKDGAKSSFVFDSAVPEAYATLDTVQKEHAKYNSNQVRNPESQERDADPLYQYDGVSPSEGSMSVAGVTVGSEGGGSGGGVVRGVVPDPPSSLSRPRRRLEAKNILYEDHELPPDSLKHRSLRTGSYNVYPDKTKGTSYITCRCKTQTLVVTFFTGLALVLALAALVLSILLWFGLYESSSASSTSTFATPTGCNCPSES